MERRLSTEPPPRESSTLRLLRSLILGLFVMGSVGTGVELLLLEHHEELWQRLPLVLLGVALLIVTAHALLRRRGSLRLFQLAMVAFGAGGLVGIWQHYRVNVEFEHEMYPALAGLELFGKALEGAMPALAPGTMIQLGLLGLLYTFRHPVFIAGRSINDGDE